MKRSREFPRQPVVGVGGVVLLEGRAVLVRRGSEPLKGEWSIPGGTLELGETLVEGVERELREETGLRVRAVKLIEVFERIFLESSPSREPRRRRSPRTSRDPEKGPRFHFVIADYLCEPLDRHARPRPGSDVTHVALARESELGNYFLTPTATRILKKAFRMARRRAK